MSRRLVIGQNPKLILKPLSINTPNIHGGSYSINKQTQTNKQRVLFLKLLLTVFGGLVSLEVSNL